MFTEIRKAMHEQTENFNKEIENIKKDQTKIIKLGVSAITELKYSIEGLNNRRDKQKKRSANLKTIQRKTSNQRSKKKKE